MLNYCRCHASRPTSPGRSTKTSINTTHLHLVAKPGLSLAHLHSPRTAGGLRGLISPLNTLCRCQGRPLCPEPHSFHRDLQPMLHPSNNTQGLQIDLAKSKRKTRCQCHRAEWCLYHTLSLSLSSPSVAHTLTCTLSFRKGQTKSANTASAVVQPGSTPTTILISSSTANIISTCKIYSGLGWSLMSVQYIHSF